LNWSGRNEHPFVLFLILEEIFPVLTHSI
jgi:hypothetical protein